MTKPIIGVTTSISDVSIMWQCIRLGIRLAGGKARRITAIHNEHAEDCDGFVISGGADIDPARYGQENTASIDLQPERDTLEQRVIEHALHHSKPMVGICRGAQMINIVKGGTLHQNARDIYADFLPTTTTAGKMLQRRPITIDEHGAIADIFGSGTLHVNSIHHQAIDALGSGLCVSARDRHGIIQAIENDCGRDTVDKDALILGVQWHPEFMLYRSNQRAFFRALVTACRHSR